MHDSGRPRGLSDSTGKTERQTEAGSIRIGTTEASSLSLLALQDILESGKQIENMAIFTASMSTLQVLNSPDPDQTTQGLHSSLAKLTAPFPESLMWDWQETKQETDLAKIGSQSLRTQNHVTYREAKTLPHSRFNGDWKKDKGGYHAHLDPVWRLEGPSRQLSSVCAQGTVV